MLKPIKQFNHKPTIMIFVIVGGLVALASLSVVANANCAVSLDFKMSPLPSFQIKKDACSPK
ncbi:vertebrate ancient opsin isoform M [Nostoc cycadae WK-1]|uniref:Vertebrate ancient opsin isoform M n=1 Tax=Nostoc cycadae WK-1 TaxID=1861711 RepID=A0A2H6LR71_9NOSO|nr:vertebrate ancient opsin isoform M [Nostoc cycadae WK-1]